MSRPLKVSDSLLLSSLSSGLSVKSTLRTLGYDGKGSILKRCRKNPELLRAYEECRERGMKRAGAGWRS